MHMGTLTICSNKKELTPNRKTFYQKPSTTGEPRPSRLIRLLQTGEINHTRGFRKPFLDTVTVMSHCLLLVTHAVTSRDDLSGVRLQHFSLIVTSVSAKGPGISARAQ